jgi:methionine-R-sulfoxide reductase
MNRRTLLKFAGLTAFGAWAGFGCGPDTSSAGGSNASTTKESDMKTTVSVMVYNSKGQLVGPVTEPKVVKTDAEWEKQLGTAVYEIARAKGTERPFCGNLLDNHKKGVYACVCCNLPLFSSDAKFNSGTGWPSFFQPVAKENVVKHTDADGYREEILCSRCDCHLGHVFDDVPDQPTGLRFCVNSASLVFTDSDKLATLADPAAKS